MNILKKSRVHRFFLSDQQNDRIVKTSKMVKLPSDDFHTNCEILKNLEGLCIEFKDLKALFILHRPSLTHSYII